MRWAEHVAHRGDEKCTRTYSYNTQNEELLETRLCHR